jgi:uncharacterized protein involved in exopolysaccharide biosynthesis
MSEMQDFIKLKESVERKRQEVSRAEGALEQTLQQLKEKGYNSLEEAESKVKQLKTKAENKKKEAEDLQTEYEEEFHDRL